MIDELLERWRHAELIDAATAERIRTFEAARGRPRQLRWPVLLALSLGGLMVSAGLLLFVAAHWEDLAPEARTALLLSLLAGCHAAAVAVADRFPQLATTLHGIGTATLGATVFLVGQTYHLESNWALGVLLWAVGAWAGCFLLRSWPQILFAAVLTPAWAVAEWTDRVARLGHADYATPLAGLLLLSLVYLLADPRGWHSTARITLATVGAIAILPLGAFVAALGAQSWGRGMAEVPPAVRAFWWGIALLVPLGLAVRLRGREAWLAMLAAVWVIAGVNLGRHAGVLAYLWAATGAVGLTASGVYDASHRRINLGVAAFAVTVVVFYFSSVLDKLGRATSLLAGGVLFLGLGWMLERVRRRLVQSTDEAVAS